jgi:hypothetical protein
MNMDMEKAFNKMEWDSILAITRKLGFHSTWINWIKIFISSLLSPSSLMAVLLAFFFFFS